jgi:adenylate kinase family enzyme
MTKLIVLRGPSGSGKSTVAQKLLEMAKDRIVLIEQDHYRFIFQPAGGGSKPNSDTIKKMIQHNVLVALADGYNVILEGILSEKSYAATLEEIFTSHPEENYMYYFNISFEETMRRHNLRNIPEDKFGETEMREWYPAAHRSNHRLERIIPESSSFESTIDRIVREVGI